MTEERKRAPTTIWLFYVGGDPYAVYQHVEPGETTHRSRWPRARGGGFRWDSASPGAFA